MTDSSGPQFGETSRPLEIRAAGLSEVLRDKFRQSLAKRARIVYDATSPRLMTPLDPPVATNTSTSLDQNPSPDIQLCPGCSSALDVRDLEPLARITCPQCQTRFSIASELLHFKLTSVLGQGGMGSVYKAFDNSLDRYVALKLLRSDFTANTEYLDRLQREAGIMAQLSHPNVVRVFSIGSDRGKFFLAMELVEHGTLDDILQNQNQLAEIQALELGIQAARGLQAAHDAGVLHRDVKPGNILFVNAQTVKITDFGLAESADQATSESDEIIGTPYYIAPERLNRQREDCRSDIYSLGATLFHTIAGRPPFEAADATAVALKRLKSQPPSLATYAPHVSGSTAFVINRTLHKDPAQRYQSYDELIEHLEYARNELLNNTGKPQARARLVLEDDEQQKLWAWVSIGMLAVVALAAGGFFLFRNTSKSTTAGSGRSPTEMASKTPSGATQAFEDAADLLSRSQFEKAADAFRNIATQNPKAQPLRSWALLYAGISDLFIGRTADAATTFRELESAKLDTVAGSTQLPKFFAKIAQASTLAPKEVDAFSGQFDRSNHELFGVIVLGLKRWYDGDTEGATNLLKEYRLAESHIERSEWTVELRGPVTSLLGQSATFQLLVDRNKPDSTAQEKLALIEELQTIQGPFAARAKQLIPTLEAEAAEVQKRMAAYPTMGVYRILNRKSGMTLKVRGGNKNDGARIEQGVPDNSKVYQEWLVWPERLDVYRIQARHSKKMLDLVGNSHNEGASLGQYPSKDELPQQRWKLEKHGDGSFSIIAFDTKKVIAVKDGSMDDSAEIVQVTDTGAPEQRWELRPVAPVEATPPDGVYMIATAHNRWAIDVDDASHDNGAKLIQWESNDGAQQRWRFQRQNDGFYKIEAVHSGKVMDVEAKSKNDGAKVHQWNWVEHDNQLWKVTMLSDGRFQFSPKHASDKVLGAKGSSGNKEVDLVIRNASGTPDQYWSLVPER